jgi:uncharacterized protein YdaU (DUF1376 family)
MPRKPAAPSMQFYVREWLASTLGLPLEAKGLHIDLLCIAWDRGALPDDPAWRAHISGTDFDRAATLWAMLKPRWKLTKNGWKNPRQERQRRELARFKARQSHASGIRWASFRDTSGIRPASVRDIPNGSSSTSTSTAEDQDLKPAAPRPVPFRVYAAIGALVRRKASTEDVGELMEQFKGACAKQGVPYNSDWARKAIDVALVTTKRRRA